MRRWLPWLIPALLLGVAGCGSSSGQDDLNPQQALLRLSDLPAGYDVGDDTGCGLDPEGASPRLTQLILKYRPSACSAEFAAGFPASRNPANPGFIQGFVVKFPADTAAVEGFGAVSDLADWEGVPLQGAIESTDSPDVGDEARSFHVPATRLSGPGSIVCWRSGRVVSCIFVTSWTPGAQHLVKGSGIGRSIPQLNAAAAMYANKQQAHIESPTPVTGPKQADPALKLDDPRLGVPVYWLGTAFDPGGSLPPIRLTRVDGPMGGSDGLYLGTLRIEYGDGLPSLDTWTREEWPAYRRSVLGRLMVDSPCTQTRSVRVPGGRAVIYAGYKSTEGRCPNRPPPQYIAHIYLGDVVVGVNTPISTLGFGNTGPYNSLAGMLAIAHGLRPKTP